ncbi:TPA: biotin/lipoyl-binding protein [Klebsiella aerogenes]|nr:HlyD family secretion protein [Klebsiella aerogenes]
MKKLKYLSTLIIAACAIIAAWLVWNYYTQSPWTRDGKIRAEQVGITPQVSGSILQLNVKDNQLVNAGDVLFRIDDTPYRIAVLNAQAQLAKAKAELAKAKAEQTKAASDVTRRRSLSQTVVKAPVDGWITNLSTRVGDYASVGHPVFALVDSHSFYVLGYFEETKLRHIREGDSAQVVLYSSKQTLQGHVSSIGRAIVDQSVEGGSALVANIKPNIPWVRLAQRVPVRIEFDKLPADVTLVSGTTCTVSIGGQ